MTLILESLFHHQVLVIMGSLTTCDPGDIQTTITTLSQNAVKCSVIGLAAEVSICKMLCNKTSGMISDTLIGKVIEFEAHVRRNQIYKYMQKDQA